MSQRLPFPPALLEALAAQVRSGQLTMGPPQSPAPPEPMSTEEARAQALQELTEARAYISDIIVEVNQTTEADTIAAGEALTRIVSETESYVRELRESFSDLQTDGGADGGGIVSAISEQSTAMNAYISDVSEGAKVSADCSRKALEQTQTIVRVGSTINEVARSSKMLALNASIEAARLGNAGRSFAVIANQMQSLSERVHESNNLVAELAASLLELLPQVVQAADGLDARSTEFTATFEEHLTRVKGGTERLEQALETSMQGGDQRLDRILGASQDALSHLQFQDPCAQKLMRIDKKLETVQRRQIALLEEGDAGAIDDPLQEELGGGIDDSDAPESGEVMLF